MNNVYIYRDNFISFLNLISYLFKNKIKPYNIKPSFYTPNLFENIITLNIPNNPKIIEAFIKCFKIQNFKKVYNVFLSNNPNKEIIIYYYLLNYFKYRENLPKMLNLKCVSLVLKINKHVSSEAHKLKGFVRFVELKNHVLYAEITPDNNVLEILSYHFKTRLKNEYWLIKDKKREIISVYDKKEFYIINSQNFNLTKIFTSDEETEFAEMWKLFYATIAIKERTNEHCRMNFMPKKYWANILEVRDEL